MSLRMKIANYGGSMPITLAGPTAGTTTWGGSGFDRFKGPMAYGMAGDAMYGDPGLFSFLGKVAKTGLGFVSKLGIPIASGLAGAAGSLIPGGGLFGGPPAGPGFPALLPPPTVSRFAGTMPISLQTQRQIPTPGVAGVVQRAIPGGATGMQGCPAGYRPNKSGYTLKSGQYIAPNTVCVKSRRMNPLNPRALSRSMKRISSAKRAATVLGRITIRKVC